jgi:hypothetical protein
LDKEEPEEGADQDWRAAGPNSTMSPATPSASASILRQAKRSSFSITANSISAIGVSDSSSTAVVPLSMKRMAQNSGP